MRGPLSLLTSKMSRPEAAGVPIQSDLETMQANWRGWRLGCSTVAAALSIALVVDAAQHIKLHDDLPPVTVEVDSIDLMSKIPAGAATFLLVWASVEAHSWREDENAPEPDAEDVAA